MWEKRQALLHPTYHATAHAARPIISNEKSCISVHMENVNDDPATLKAILELTCGLIVSMEMH
jgi:hypothetical protein